MHALTLIDRSRSDRPASGVVAGREHDRVLEQPGRPLRAVHGQGDGHGLVRLTYTKHEDREPRAGVVAGRDNRSPSSAASSGAAAPNPIDPQRTRSITLSLTTGRRSSAHDARRSDERDSAAGLVGLTAGRIAFQSNRPGNWDIYVVNRKGNVVRVTSKDAEFHPTWAPNGNAIALISDRTGATEIYSVMLPVLGRSPRRHAAADVRQGFKANPSWGARLHEPFS